MGVNFYQVNNMPLICCTLISKSIFSHIDFELGTTFDLVASTLIETHALALFIHMNSLLAGFVKLIYSEKAIKICEPASSEVYHVPSPNSFTLLKRKNIFVNLMNSFLVFTFDLYLIMSHI